MNGDLFTGPTPHERNAEATEWLLRALRGLAGPAQIRDAVEELKLSLVMFLGVPDGRLQALMRPRPPQRTTPQPNIPRNGSIGVNCPTCGHETQIVATDEKCPICTRPMVMRRNRTNGQAFLGCSGYPSCRGTINLQNLLLRRASTPQNTGGLGGVDEPMRLIEIN